MTPARARAPGTGDPELDRILDPETGDRPDEPATAVNGWLAASGRLAQQALVLTSWAVLYLAVVLVAMMGLIRLTTGWETVVLGSGSMNPTLRVGDVLFLDEHPDEAVGQQTVITFETDDGELVTHRVFEVDTTTGSYITKGDANPTPDADPVPRERVVGVGWLVVPYLGLPAVWFAEGNLAALAAMGVLLVASTTTVVLTRRRGTSEADEPDDRPMTSAQRGIMRVRIVVGVIIVMLILLNGRELVQNDVFVDSRSVLVITLVGLAGVTALARFRATRTTGRSARRLATLELGADTLLVVIFVSASGTSTIGWVMMALPIVEAAVRYRLTGAFIHWIIMSALSVSALFWTNRLADTPQATAITSLEQLIDRLGVLLLIVIPTSYLAEQLLGDVTTHRRATRRASARSAIVERVTDAGIDVARLGVDVFPTLTRAAVDLGFDVADCQTFAGGVWTSLAATSPIGIGLPGPHDPAGTLRPADLDAAEVFISAEDPDRDAVASMEAAGLALVARLVLLRRDDAVVVLRVGATRLAEDPSSQVMTLRLLAAQAAIALQNGHLLAEIEHQAHHDTLTGLPNRTSFADRLDRALVDHAHEPWRVATMFLDLNGFKAVNDRFGHHAGDDLLVLLAERLRAAVGDDGFVARLGGDEFTVLLSGHAPEFADEIARRIHAGVDEPFTLADDTVRVGTSIGIAVGHDGATVAEMMRRSDVAMYWAKSHRHTGGTEHYRDELDQDERRTTLLTHSLRTALAHDELHVEYQPIVATVNGAIAGAEALVRWTHPELGVIRPDELLEVVESSDLVHDFNRWILRHVIREVTALDAIVGPERSLPFVAVNVSPSELDLGTLTTNVSSALDASGMSPHRLVVELSERMVAESPGAVANIGRLEALGVRLALDDFGEGHTSLTQLRRLPIDLLKLDRTFVCNASTSPADRTVLRSVVALARDLGFSVVAEGVEDIAQMTIVTKDGAEFVQGFGLYRPMSIDDLGALLSRPIPATDRLDVDDLDLAPLPHATTSATPLRDGSATPAAPPAALATLPPPVLGTQVVGR